MLGVVGKELDVQMSPDNVPSNLSLDTCTLRHLSIGLQILPKDLEVSRLM